MRTNGLSCGCTVQSTDSGQVYGIKFCPLHAHAGELLAACKATFDLWKKYGLGDDDAESEPIYDRLRGVIAEVEGQP